jgi:hypothetical protein
MTWLDFLQRLWESLSGIAGKEFGAFIAAAIVALAGLLVKWFVKWARSILDYHRRLNRVRRDASLASMKMSKLQEREYCHACAS